MVTCWAVLNGSWAWSKFRYFISPLFRKVGELYLLEDISKYQIEAFVEIHIMST